MKVLIIAPHTKKEAGGWGRYSHEVITHLQKNGVEVTFDIKDTYDAVHALDIWPYALKAYWAVLGTKKPLILSGVGTYSVVPLSVWWKRIILQWIFRRTQTIVCISDYTRDQIQPFAPYTKIETVLLGLTALPKKNIEHYERYPLILTVGEVKNRKGQLDTFKAVLRLKEKYPHIQYVTIGNLRDTAYVQEIKNLGNSEHIKMLEKISDEEMAAWYERATVFCLNSNNDTHGHFEGFGLVILEAGQFGVPAVGSKNCGIESAIKNGVNGYLAEQGNVDDIAQKIEQAMLLPKEAVKDFTRTFDWNKTAQRYIAIYSGN